MDFSSRRDPHAPNPRRRWALGLSAAPLLLVACAGRPQPAPPQPRAVAPAPEEQPAEERPVEWRPERPTTVVIEPGDAPHKPSLLEASEEAKKKRATAPSPVAVINNDNLAEYAEKGKLTFAEPVEHEEEQLAQEPDAGAREAGEGDAGEGGAPEPEPVGGESYWREGIRERRRLWNEAVELVSDLEERVGTLRREFYSEDDPYVRDSQVKPAWDRVLDRLEEARLEVDTRRAELEAFMEEGRRNGALPGWLREGIELEPRPEAPDGDLPVLESQEPVVMEEGGGGR